MPFRRRNGRRGNGRDNRNSNERRGGGGNTRGQNQACKWCKKTNHSSNDCRYKMDNDSNNANNSGGRSERGRNGTLLNKCGYCRKLGHGAENCFQNPASPKYRGRGRNPNQTCEICGFTGHLAANCRTNNEQGGSNGPQRLNIPQNPWQQNIFGQPFQKGGQGSTFQQNTFNAPPQQYPCAQIQPVDPNFASQVKANGKWNRRCKDCQQWHADCDKGNSKSNETSKDTKMIDSGYDSDDEQEEPRLVQAFPFLQRTGLKWLCPKSGLAFEVDCEGDVIMLETVSIPLSFPQPFQNFVYTKWQTDQAQGWDLPFKPPHLLNRIPREQWPTNHQAAHIYDGIFTTK